ncbi:MAG: DUF4932 domain-containing protein [Anaerolineaceae bacterium]|nr:MAG: DUF4932 domain-containing protein [Anaerolineaceae bacterium]
MSDQSDVIIKQDDRIRLMSAVLAATDYPEQAQKLKPHGTHVHARATRKYLTAYRGHPVVKQTQDLLDQGTPLEALFALVLLMTWPELKIANAPSWMPEGYDAALRDFYTSAALETLWKRDGELWQKANKQAQNAFAGRPLRDFFAAFIGDIAETMTFMPNICYPTDHEIGFKLGGQLVAIAPPPLAWGDSPPWPYDEPTMLTQSYRAAIQVFGRELLKAYLRRHADQLDHISANELPVSEQFKAQYTTWEAQFTTLFLSAAVAIYLEDHVDEREYQAYLLMEKKLRGMAVLPGVISVLRRFLKEKDSSNKYSTLIEFLPIFPRQLRVAQKIVRI